MESEDRALALAELLTGIGGSHLLSVTYPYSVSTVVNLFSPSDSASMFRWLSEVVNATTLLRPAGSGTAPSSTKPVIDHITVLTHFDFSSDGGLLPSTSSSIFVPHTGPTVQDAAHQSYRSTDFGDTHVILLQPMHPHTHNAFPLRTICGLAKGLSLRNMKE